MQVESLQVVLRALQLDRWTTEFLTKQPDATVLYLGCGLDSRVYRIDPPPGVRWFDVDYPEVIDLRQKLYPERAGYQMIGSSVTEPGWLDEVPGDKPAWIVAERLTYYLSEGEMKSMLNRLTSHFPSGQMAFDAVGQLGAKLAKRNTRIQTTGATIGWWIDDPRDIKLLDPKLELVTELRPIEAHKNDKLRCSREGG